MIGVDCNILIQIAIADHPAHQATLSKLEGETERGTKIVFPPLVATEFLHVVTEERRFAPPLTMPVAIAWLRDFMANPSIALIYPNQATMSLTLQWMDDYKLGRKRILDCHLAAVLHSNGVSRLLTSNEGDFKIFQSLEIVCP